MKKSFVMYMSWGPLFQNMKAEEAGLLIQAIYEYQNSGNEPDRESSINPIFQMIKATIDEDSAKYNERSKKNRENVTKRYNRIRNDTTVNERTNLYYDATDTYSESDPDPDSDPDPKSKKTKPKEPKEVYGESGNVKLTIREYEKLVSDYGTELTQKAIEYLDWYIADKGYKSKSNYSAIRRWVIDAVKERGRASPEKFDMDAFLIETIREESG